MALILVLVNQSNLAPVSDYKFEVLIGTGAPATSKVIACGKVAGHTRADGWKVLVQKLLDQVDET